MALIFNIETILTQNWFNIELFWHWTVCKQNLYLYLAELAMFDQPE